MERMTAQDASCTEPRTFQGAVLDDGFQGVLTAGRVKTAGRRKCARQRLLVNANGCHQQRTDRAAAKDVLQADVRLWVTFLSSQRISSFTCAMPALSVTIAVCAINTRSQPSGSSPAAASERTASRISRRARLRCTAPPTFFDVTYPTRVGEYKKARAAFKAHSLPRQRAPSLRMRSKSAVRSNFTCCPRCRACCAPASRYRSSQFS